MQQVAAKSQIWFVVAHDSEDSGQDVGLLGDTFPHTWSDITAGVINDKGNTKLVDATLLFSMITHVCVVASQYKHRILEPCLLTGLMEETPQRIIRISDTFMDGQLFFLEPVFIRVRHMEGMVTGQSKEGGHERLFHVAHLHLEVL